MYKRQAHLNTKIIVVLNDNGMSISPNIGGLSHYLGRLRGSRKYISMKAQIKKNISKVPLIGEGMVAGMQHARDSIKYAVIDGVLFEELGFKYFGPIDGHDLQEVCETLELAKQTEGPVLLHVMTQKGKGYSLSLIHIFWTTSCPSSEALQQIHLTWS